MKRKFLINPQAARGRAVRELEDLKRHFARHDGTFDFVVCDSRPIMIRETAHALHAGFEQIVAVGGDGTINAVVNGFFNDQLEALNPQASLALAPLGSGCDYSRTVMGRSGDWRAIVRAAKKKPIDVCVYEGKLGRSLFINSASAGSSAEIVARKGRLPFWIPRQLSYVVPTLQHLPSLRLFRAQVTLDGVTEEGEYLGIFMAKGSYSGGGMKFGGGVALDDGLFDVTLIGRLEIANAVLGVPRLFLGGLDQVSGIRKFRARKIAITPRERVPLELDGEVGQSAPGEFRILSRALNLTVP